MSHKYAARLPRRNFSTDRSAKIEILLLSLGEDKRSLQRELGKFNNALVSDLEPAFLPAYIIVPLYSYSLFKVEYVAFIIL